MNNFHETIKGPAVAVDTVVLTVDEGLLKVLLIKIGSGPYANQWALPGGLVGIGESVDEAALRALRQKTNIKYGHIEQLYTFGDVNRDVRGQVVSVAYMLLIDNKSKVNIITPQFYTDVQWFDIKHLPDLAFDHQQIIDLAYKRLGEKTTYSNIATFLTPSSFTLTELQHVYESILGRSIDKRNFRKKIQSLKMIAPSTALRTGANRPARVYRFVKKKVFYY